MPIVGGGVQALPDRHSSSSIEIGRRGRHPAPSTADLESSGGCDAIKQAERGCRICQLSLGSGVDGNEQEENIEFILLGCSCKGDLASAHRKCAETWFKIKGNVTCEICGTIALNISGERAEQTTVAPASTRSEPVMSTDPHHYWHGRRVMNYVFVCMVFAFIVSWFFHFKVLR